MITHTAIDRAPTVAGGRHTADQLEAEVRRTRLMLDALTEGLVLVDTDGRLVDWNAAAEFILGVPAHEMRSRTALDQAWQMVRTDGTPWPVEESPAALAAMSGRVIPEHIMGMRRPSGELLWLRINARPLHDLAGQVSGVLVAFDDVTEAIDLQRRTEAISSRLQIAIDSGSVGTALLDARSRITYVNPAFTEIVGSTAELLLGLRLVDIFHPAEPAAREIRHVDAANLPHDARDVQLRGDGERQRWVRMNLAALPPLDGAPASLVQLTDISDRRALEVRITRNEELARVSLDALEHGVIFASPTLGIQRMNPAATQILGYEAAELFDLWMSPTWKMHDETGRPISAEEFAGVRAIEAAEPVRHQILWLRHRDTTWRRVRMSAVPFSWTDEVILFFTDITEFTPPDAPRPAD